MAFSLYDATVPSWVQMLHSVRHLIDKAEAHCQAHGLEPKVLIDARLAADMHPFGYQVKSVVVHSLGAIEGVRKGTFSPDNQPWPDTFDGLRERVDQTLEVLAQLERSEVNGFVGADMRFESGRYRVDYTAEHFLMSFTMPNFYFHATTAYAVLRAQGLPLGKLDYLGKLRGNKA